MQHMKEYTIKGHPVVINQTNLEQYWQFIHERHLIWYKRFVLQMPQPWTEDRILTEYKFTNVYRELDKGTIYLLDNIVSQQGKASEACRLWSMIIYRMFNRLSTFEAIGFQYYGHDSMNAMFKKLRELNDAGIPIYTDAHMVCAYANVPGKDKLERIETMMRQTFPRIPSILEAVTSATTLETIFDVLHKNVDGFGPFNSYEVAVDISYDLKLTTVGEDEWANAGPGAENGTKSILPSKPKGLSYLDWMIWLRDNQWRFFRELGLDFASIAYKRPGNPDGHLTLRNIEHCLCEYFKYNKAFNGTGRPRNSFKPVTTDPEDMARLRG